MRFLYVNERYKDDPEVNLLFCFANTGKEREETLVYLKNIQEKFSIPIVWLEAEIIPEKGKGTTYKKVDFEINCFCSNS